MIRSRRYAVGLFALLLAGYLAVAPLSLAPERARTNEKSGPVGWEPLFFGIPAQNGELASCAETIGEPEKNPTAEPAGNLRYQEIAAHITEEEIDLLARIAYLEARGEPEEGQCAVIEVVLNRVLDSRFPDTIREVLKQPGQFTPAGLLEQTDAAPLQYDCVKKVLEDQAEIVERDVLYFSTRPQNKRIFAKIGGHYFCRG